MAKIYLNNKKTQNNRSSTIIWLALLIVLMSMLSHRAISSNGVTAIESYCKEIDQYVRDNPALGRIFANVASGAKAGSDIWRKFKSEEERHKADDGYNLNQNAKVWLKSGVVVIAYCMFQSPSRDWAHYVTYYYRNDGSLAKIHSELNTFYGKMKVIRDQYYSPSAEMLQSSVQYLDLLTKKEKKPTEDFIDKPIPMYKRNKDLPFINLLKAAP